MSSASGFCRNPMADNGYKQTPEIKPDSNALYHRITASIAPMKPAAASS